MNYKTKQILIVALAVLGAFAVNPNTAQNNKQIYLSDAAIPVAVKITDREYFINRVSRQRVALTDRQLKRLLYIVGFRGKHLKEAWAIVKRETNGRPLAHNKNRHTGDNSYGIFQINMIGYLGNARRDKFNLNSNAELFNPVKNAEIAYYMSNGGKNWSAWHGINPKAKEWLKEFPA